MQCLASDLRRMVRYRRVEQEDESTGDAVPSYVREPKVIFVGFTPRSSGRTQTDSGTSEDPTRMFAIVSFAHPFALGDRMGPAGMTEPTFEIVSCLDYPGSQNLEVRPI